MTTIPEGESGYTIYFDESAWLGADEERTYEDAMSYGDAGPDVLALVALEDETTTRSEFSLGPGLHELRVVVTDEDQPEIQAHPS
ncbi:hypothetical protein [Salinadaptatus halalkaliphilus]|uniref:hypothetical protein n=1 Tax=Salinadaptatus halalkaliphilus TaxID=2419781 RepID=UPI00114398D6|nr:hypothetical protein [Salinadaptatus halalkaliphilus]